MIKHNSNNPNYRPELDGLRGVAVLAVILGHALPDLFPNGFLGVDIFFVISGYVITQSLIARKEDSLASYLLNFYRRRIKRLMPALYVYVTVMILLTYLFHPPGLYRTTTFIKTGFTSLFGISNIYLSKISSDYFASSTKLNPFTHTWSLAVEEQFYFIFPIIVWFFFIRKNKKSKILFISILLFLGVMSISSILLFIKHIPIEIYYLSPFRFWEITAGTLIFLIQDTAFISKNPIIKWASKISVSTIFIATIGILFFPKILSVWFSILAIVILISCLTFLIQKDTFVYNLLTNKFIIYVGLISYSLYLWHWGVLSISRATIGVNYITLPFQFMIMFLFASGSYHFIEKPLRHTQWKTIKLKQFAVQEIVITGLISICILTISIFFLRPMHQKNKLYTGKPINLQKQGIETLLLNVTIDQYTWTAHECVLSNINDNRSFINLNHCTLGDFKTAKRHFLVIGDSFAPSEIDMFTPLIANDQYSITTTASFGAQELPEISEPDQWSANGNHYYNDLIPPLIQQLNSGDVIFIINANHNASPLINKETTPLVLKHLQKTLIDFIQKSQKKGLYVIYQSRLPFIQGAGCTPEITAPQWWTIPGVSPCNYYTRNESLERRSQLHNMLLSLEKEHKNFAVLDLFDVFCPDDVCRHYSSDEVILYRDEWSHPSVEASILAQPVLLDTVEKLLKRNGESL